MFRRDRKNIAAASKGEKEGMKLEFNSDEDLIEVWPKVLCEYERVTKQRLDPNTDFRGLQNSIDESLRNSSLKSSSNARKIMQNVGRGLQKFGEIIAQTTSVVFGPCAQCWNAISFVITAAQNYGQVLDGFVTLMERSLAFINRLNYFLEQEVGPAGSYLPKHLRKPAYDILAHFLDILKSSYKLATSTKKKLKVMFDIVLFDGDDDVRESLDLMEELVQDFTNAQIDEILVDVKGLARYLRASEEERSRHQTEIQEHLQNIYKINEEVLVVSQETKLAVEGFKTQEEHKKNLKKIAEWWGLPDLDQKPWAKHHSTILKSRVDNTGAWLERQARGLVHWADPREHRTKVLTVRGRSGFGKTFASNYVISYLQRRYGDTSKLTDRATLAYYYYGKVNDDSLEKCLGSIVYQLAEEDQSYARAVAEACRQPASSHAEDRWDRLVPKLHHAMQGTYFICIDGLEGGGQGGSVDATITAIAQFAMSDIKGIAFRFYISGTDGALSHIPLNDPNVSNILLGRCKYLGNETVRVEDDEEIDEVLLAPLVNASDLEAVARARIEEIVEEKTDLREILTESNIKKMVAGVRGHYAHLEAKVTQINACDTKQKVQNVVNSAGDDLKTDLEASLKALESSLNMNQIERLNELLVWVIGLKGGNSVELLQSALFLAFGETLMLKSLVATTFSNLLAIEGDDRIKLRSDQMRPILSAKEHNVSRVGIGNLSTVDLTENEIELCRRFVRNACGSYDFERFRFEHFFNHLAGKQNTHVHVEEENALDVRITLSCLKALCEKKEDSNLDKLCSYASIWFYEHLKSFTDNFDYFEPNRQSLIEIGKKVIRILYEPEDIDSWFMESHLQLLKADWVVNDTFVDPLLKLLKNPHVASGYREDTKKDKWIKSVFHGGKNRYCVLEKVAARLAARWFSTTSLTNREYFWVPYGIVTKVRQLSSRESQLSDHQQIGSRDFDENSKQDITDVNNFIQWAKEHTDLNTSSSLWAFRVGATFTVTQHHEIGLEEFKKAEAELEDNWSLLLLMAETYEQLKDFQSALNYINKLKALQSPLIDTDAGYKGAYWERILLKEGILFKQLKNYSSAAGCFQSLLEQDGVTDQYVHTTALNSLFESWIEEKAYGAIIYLMRKWRDSTDLERGLSYWLSKTVHSDNIHGWIITAASRVGVVEEVWEMYKQAMENLSVTPTTDNEDETQRIRETKELLRCFQASFVFHGYQVEHQQERALQDWEDIIHKAEDSWSSWWIVYKANRIFARSLLDKATSKGLEEASSRISESYASRLEALSRVNHRAIRDCRQGTKDPRLCLTRLHVLQGERDLVHEEAKERLRSVFDDWPEDTNDESLRDRFANLAQTLNVLDDDVNSIAAWQAAKPRQLQQGLLPVVNSAGPDQTQQQVVGAVADTPGSNLKSTSTSPGQSNTKNGKPDSRKDPPKAYISGSWICDYCETRWENMLVDCWACKHCLCVQLCSDCHYKLQNDEIHPLVCSKRHKFLYLPPFNHAVWETASPEMMILGGKTVVRKQWLDGLREKWGVRQDQIDNDKLEAARRLKATKTIVFYILRWRRKLLRRRAQDGPFNPVLHRSKTIA